MHRCLVVVALAVSLPAQVDRLTAHPQYLPHTGGGNANPFGNHLSFCEARNQLLLRAQHLPGPGAVLIALEFHALANGLANAIVVYQSLEIAVSPVSPSAPRWANFNLNLPQPTTVVQMGNHSTNWGSSVNPWHRYPVNQFYVHDGVSALTIEIRKEAVGASFPNGNCTGLHRPDLETMLVAFGGPGSAAHVAPVAMMQVIPIDVRLVWSNAPTSFLRSPIPAPLHHGFAIGSTLDHVVMATPGSLAALACDLQFSVPVTLPFAAGQWWVQGFVLGADVIAANGEAIGTYPIPNVPAFVGQRLTFQALVFDAATNQFAFTNASDCFLGQ